MELKELKELIKEKGTKALCKERIKASKSVQVVKEGFGFEYIKSKPQEKSIKEEDDEKGIKLKVVANMAMYMDSQDDVLLSSCWNRSIADRGKGDDIPFLRDHIYKTDAIIGKTIRFYNGKVDLRPYGYDGEGDGLIHEAMVMKDYDEKTYAKYREGSIKQHSIGLFYIKIDLAVNDEEYDEEYKLFNNYVDKIINKEKALEKGYFWLVSEIFLRENSAVVFASNPLTPTLEASQPSSDTDKNETPPIKTKSDFIYNLIRK